jgi:hypothetical protein
MRFIVFSYVKGFGSTKRGKQKLEC